MHFSILDFSAHEVAVSLLEAPELGDKGLILGVGGVELLLFVVFELWVVNHLLWDFVTSEHPDGDDVELWLLTNNGDGSPSVLSEVIDSLEEAVEQVVELVLLHTFTFVLVVVQEVDAVAISVVVFKEVLHTLASFVRLIHEEGLEVV